MINAFYVDEIPWINGGYIIQNHFDKIEVQCPHGSYQLLEARLLNLSYENYLVFCKQIGAMVVRSPGAKYAAVRFFDKPTAEKLTNLLNKKFTESWDYTYGGKEI